MNSCGTVAWMLISLATALACASPGEPPAAAAPAVSSTAAASDWSTYPDFDALRAELGAKPEFNALCEARRPLRELARAFQKKRWQEVVTTSAPWLAQCPVDTYVHMLRAVALLESGREEEARDHRLWAQGLLESVLATGDGKTPSTAYKVISVFEEYGVLAMLGYEPKGQALTSDRVDAMTVEREGESTVIYFDPSPSFARMLRMLGGDPEKKIQ